MVLDPPQDTEVTLSASHEGGSWKSLDQRGRLRSWATIRAAFPTASLGPIWHLGSSDFYLTLASQAFAAGAGSFQAHSDKISGTV